MINPTGGLLSSRRSDLASRNEGDEQVNTRIEGAAIAPVDVDNDGLDRDARERTDFDVQKNPGLAGLAEFATHPRREKNSPEGDCCPLHSD